MGVAENFGSEHRVATPLPNVSQVSLCLVGRTCEHASEVPSRPFAIIESIALPHRCPMWESIWWALWMQEASHTFEIVVRITVSASPLTAQVDV